TVASDQLEALTLNNSLRSLVDSAAAGLQLQSSDIAERTRAIDSLLDQPGSASRATVEAARKSEADAGLRAKLDSIWADTVLADPAAQPADRIEATRLLARDSHPQNRLKLQPLVERDAAGKYKEPDVEVRLAAQQALDALRSDQRRAELFGNLFAGLSL